MPVGFEIANGTTVAGDVDGAISFSFDAGTGANRCLWVRLSSFGTSGVTVTYNGVSMTLIDRTYNSNSVGMWYLQAPASGSNTLAISGSSAGDMIVCAVVTNGTLQSGTPYSGLTTQFGGSGTHSLAVTTTSDGMALWFDTSGNTISSPNKTNATIQNLNGGSGIGNGAAQYATGTGGSLTGTWADNGDQWFIVTLNVLPLAGSSADIAMDNFTVAASGTVFNPTATRIKEVGFVTNTTGGTTSAITVAAGGVPVGDFILIRGSCDNTGTNGVATTIAVADNSSQSGSANTYTLETAQAIADPGAASAGQQGFMVRCVVTRALLAGDVITVTYGNSTAAKAINAQQYSGVNKTTPTFGYTTQDNQTGQVVSLSASPTRIGQTVATLVAVEGGTADTFTQDADSTDGSWTTITRRGSGTTTSGATNNSADKKVTGTTAQSYGTSTMLGTSRDHCAAILVIDNAIIEGTAAITLDAFVVAASGSQASGSTGTAAITLGDFTVAASGTVLNPVSGTAAITLDNFTPSASGSETISGSAAIALNDFTVAASGGTGIVGTAAIALNDFVVAGSGTETISGSAAIALDDFTVSGTALEWPYIEPFTYANGTLAGAQPTQWAAVTGTVDTVPLSGSNPIVSNKLVPGAAITYDVSLFEVPFDDQYAAIDVTSDGAGPHSDYGTGVQVRCGASGHNGYGAWIFWSTGLSANAQYGLFREDASVNTPLYIADADFAPHRIEVRAIGSTISLYVDGALVYSTTDTTYDETNRHVILGNYNFSTAGAVTTDNLEIGEAVSGVDGTAAITLNDFVVAGSGSETITGSSAVSLANFTVAASGAVLNPVSGTAAVTLDDFVVAASGSETISGTAAITLDDFVVAASGSETISGSVAITLDNFVVAASGSEGISGSVAITLDNFVVAASGSELITGAAAIALNDFVVAASGAEEISGSAGIILDNFVVAASGTTIPSVSGSAAITLNDFTVVGNSVLTVSGAAAITLDAFVVDASGTEKITGSAAIALNNFVVAAAGTEKIIGSAAIALDNFVAAASGIMIPSVTGSAAIILNDFVVASNGSAVLIISGTSAIVLNNFSVNGNGTAGATTGFPKVWTGSAWVNKPAKVWTGSAWVITVVKVYNGSSWVTVN